MRTETRIARAVCLIALQLLVTLACFAQEPTPRLEEYMQSVVKRSAFSGSVLIAREGKVIFSRSFGMANLEDETPNTPQTRFRLASLTKQFTAAAILMLRERGELSLKDPICKYVQQCPEAWRGITVHHLLTHASGIPDFTESPDYAEAIRLPSPPGRTIARFINKPLELQPGARFRYSNSNYILLGHIIEKVSGQSYETFLRENIFKPLNMTNTGYDSNALVIKRRAAGYSIRGGAVVNSQYVDMTIPFAAGGLYSTVEDLLVWDQALYGEKLISKQSLDAMFTPNDGGYGYGWYITGQSDRRLVTHGGWMPGFATSIVRYPELKLVIIVLSNLDTSPVNTVAQNLGAILLGKKHEAPGERRAVEVNPATYSSYLGRYELTPGFVITITEERSRLMGQATGHPKIELIPESESKFFVREFDAQIRFVRDESGRVVYSVLSLNGRDAQARKIK